VSADEFDVWSSDLLEGSVEKAVAVMPATSRPERAFTPGVQRKLGARRQKETGA
jgi:hypothetical protein